MVSGLYKQASLNRLQAANTTLHRVMIFLTSLGPAFDRPPAKKWPFLGDESLELLRGVVRGPDLEITPLSKSKLDKITSSGLTWLRHDFVKAVYNFINLAGILSASQGAAGALASLENPRCLFVSKALDEIENSVQLPADEKPTLCAANDFPDWLIDGIERTEQFVVERVESFNNAQLVVEFLQSEATKKYDGRVTLMLYEAMTLAVKVVYQTGAQLSNALWVLDQMERYSNKFAEGTVIESQQKRIGKRKWAEFADDMTI